MYLIQIADLNHSDFICLMLSSHESNQEDYNKENLLLSINYDMASKKRKKDLLNNNTKVPCKR